MYMYTNHNHIPEKKKKEKENKILYHSKWHSNNRFLFRIILILAKIRKTFFPKKIFNEFWLIVR